MSIYREHVTRLGARERLQEDPGEEPAHHLVRPLCARPDPPKRRTQIKTPSPHQHIPKGKPQGTERTSKKPCRRGIWTGEKRPGRWMDGTVSVARREEGERNGQELWFSPLSLYATRLLRRLKIPVMRCQEWHAERESRRRGEERRARPPRRQHSQPTRLPLRLSCSSSTMGHGCTGDHFFNQLLILPLSLSIDSWKG
jgi:hypothetical protein